MRSGRSPEDLDLVHAGHVQQALAQGFGLARQLRWGSPLALSA
jgi:hypothetical protein